VSAVLGNVSVPTSQLATASDLAAVASGVSGIGGDTADIRIKVDVPVSSRAAASDLAAVASSVSGISGDTANIRTKVDVPVGSRLAAADYIEPPDATAYTVERAAKLDYLDANGSNTATAEALAAIPQAVWDVLTTALATPGSIGALAVAKLGLITSTTNISIGSPVAGTTVTTYQGDDYLAADGRELAWTVSTTATLTGGTVAVIVHGVGSFDGEVVDDTTVRLELTAEQSATIPPGKRHYQVIVTQADGDVLTVVDGVWTSRARVSAV
jgi:hypothetical protein